MRPTAMALTMVGLATSRLQLKCETFEERKSTKATQDGETLQLRSSSRTWLRPVYKLLSSRYRRRLVLLGGPGFWDIKCAQSTPEQVFPVTRPYFSRRLFAAFGICGSIAPLPTCIAADSSILHRLGLGDTDIYYPEFFEGLWTCHSTLIDIEVPQGEDKADMKSVELARKQLGFTAVYNARFIPYKGHIIGDRLFTTTSLVDATVGKSLVEQGAWDPEHPNRLNLVLRGGLKVENFVTKRSFGISGAGQFDTSEYSKQVFEREYLSGPPSVKASRNLTRYKWDPTEDKVSTIEVWQRVSMFQVPGERLDLMDVSALNKPVTVYNYIGRFLRTAL